MAVTGTQVLSRCMGFIDEISDSGVVNSADYIKQSPGIIDTLQRELLKVGGVFSTYEFSNFPSANILGSRFDVIEFGGEDIPIEGNGPCRAYYFESSRAGTAYIEDYTAGWNNLATVTINGTTDQFTAYKGVITPTTGATKSRIRFSGTYRYLARNIALYNVPYQSADDIPAYGKWVKKTMPSDFHSLDQIVNEDEISGYVNSSSIKLEGRNSIYINYTFKGNIRIVYVPAPAEYTNLATALIVDDNIALSVLPYGLAAQLMLHEDPAKANFFQQRYEELKASARKPKLSEEVVLQDYYGLASWR